MFRIQRRMMVVSLTWSMLLGMGSIPLATSAETISTNNHLLRREDASLGEQPASQILTDLNDKSSHSEEDNATDFVEDQKNLAGQSQQALNEQAQDGFVNEELTRMLQASILESIPGFNSSRAPTPAPRPDDFAEFNDLLRNTLISLPDTEINEMLLFQPLWISLQDLECSQLSFEDIRLNSDLRSSEEAGLGVGVVNLGLQCEFDFDWSYIFLTGNGHARVRVADSSANFGLDLYSQDFAVLPPNSATVTSCTTDINILGIEFSGNIAAEIFNLFEQLILDVVGDLLNEKICVELNALGSDLLGEALGAFSDLIAPYLEPVEAWRLDVMHPEFNMDVPDDVDLYSWNDPDGFGQFLDAALEELDTTLTTLSKDLSAPNETLAYPNGTLYPDGYDLGINVLMREYLLDENRVFELDLGDSAVLFNSHDQLTNTNISLLSLKVLGLDTFTDLQPFKRYGNHTLQNVLSWDHLSFEAVIRMEMKASSLEDSIIRDPQRVEPYVEEMEITVGVENIETVIAVMVAMDPARMKAMEVGTLLELVSMVPCVLASLHDITLAGLNVTIGDIRLPTVEGLVSPGLDRVLTDGAEIAFFMFKGTVLQMLPSLFETTVRDLVTDFLESTTCEKFEEFEEESFVDLRDLLLVGEEAKELGATGEAPYGDLTSTIYGIAQSMWQEVEPDGTLGLNSLLVGPLTESGSGQQGTLMVPEVLYNFTTNEENQVEFKTLVNRFEFAVYDLRIENLDTIVHPMAVLQPVNHPYITQSTVNLGPLEGSPLNVTLGLLMSLDIEDSPLAMNNIITVGFSVASVELFLELLTIVSTNDLLNYHLGDGLDINCWFGALSAPDLDLKGYRIKGSMQRGGELRRVLAKVSDLQLAINCVECSPGLDSLPDIVDIFDRSKVTDVLSYRIPLLLEEFAMSETMQVHFDRWVVNARYNCPHREEYLMDYDAPETWETPEFSQLSVEASDTIFFTCIVAGQVGFVLLVESHHPWELDTLEPMSGQRNFVPPEGSNIVDWTNLTETFDDLADDAREYLGGNSTDEYGVEDLGVNFLVRGFAADENGVVDFVSLFGGNPFEFVVEGVVVQIHSIKVRGLDTFTRFDVMKPIAPQTVLNSVHLRELDIDLEMSMGSRIDPQQIVTASFKFKDLNATVPLFAAFDLNFLQELELGHFLLGDKIFPCLMAAAVDIHFPQILISMGEFLIPTFDGFLPDSQEALRQSIGEVFDNYGKERVLKAFPIMFDVTARTFINTFISDFLDTRAECTHLREFTFNETPPGEEVYPFTDFVDFRELFLVGENSSALGGRGNTTYGDTFRSLTVPLNDEILAVDPRTGLSGVNSLIAPLTELLFGEPGSIKLPGNLFTSDPIEFDIGALSLNLSLAIGDLNVHNVDTLGDPMQVLMPVFMEPHFLDNSVGMGLNGRPVRVSLRFTVRILTYDGDSKEIDKDVNNDMIISLDLHSAKALFNVLLKVSEERLIDFPVRHMGIPACWAALFPAPKLNKLGIRDEGEPATASLMDVALTVARLNLTIECVECTSPGMQGLTEALASPESADSLTDIANEFVKFGMDIVTGNLVQNQIDRGLNDAARECPYDERYDPDAKPLTYEPLNFDRSIGVSSLLLLLLGVLFFLILGIVVVCSVVRLIVNRRHAKWLRTLPVQRVHRLQHQQDADKQLEDALNENTSSMFTTPEISPRVRYAMPIIILGNVAFFLSGHLSTAAAVRLQLEIAGEPFTLDRLFNFTIVDSTIDMWNAGAKEMSIFIIVFAVIWPYSKQFISLVCWFLPPSKLSTSARGSTYLWLDTLAKWSMVDIFVLLITMIAFRVEAVTPSVSFLPEDFFSLNIRIVPSWGLYANLIAQLISQVSSHYIIHYHRAIVRRATRNYEEEYRVRTHKTPTVHSAEDTDEQSGDTKQSSETDEKGMRNRLCDAAFSRPHKGERSRLVTRQIASYGLVVGTSLLLLFIITGSSLASLGVEIQGVVSFISAAGAGVYKEFNVFDISSMLVTDATAYGSFKYVAGYLLLTGVMILTVFIVPILQAFALAYHWFKPMNERERKRFAIVIEILSAWQYAEVFILAILVSSWQLAPTSETIMASQCNEFEMYFEMLSYYGILDLEDSHCFRIEASIKSGSYLLFVGALLLALLNTFVMKASFQYFYDKAAVRKEHALEDSLTPEEALLPVDEPTYKKIHPPPVLFTDTFRWLLRAEHLGDRPLKGIIVEEPSRMMHDNENISIASYGSYIDVHEVDGMQVVDC